MDDGSPNQRPSDHPPVVSYGRTPARPVQGATGGEVVLGFLFGLGTMLLGLPVYLMWAYRHMSGGWTFPLVLFGLAVAGMLLGAFSVRRPHQLPGLFPGFAAGIAGGLLIIGIVLFYALRL